MKRAITVALLMVPLFACTQHPTGSSQADVEALKAADTALSAAVAAKDVDKIASFYAETAVLMPTAEPSILGKATIVDEWRHIVAIPGFANESKLTRVETSSSNDFAYTMGTYQSRLMGEDGKMTVEPGKWLTVWKKQPDGAWKILVDTYNTDIMPPIHQPSAFTKAE